MPDTDPLSELARQLAIVMGPTVAMRSTPWVDPLPIRKARRDAQRQFDSIETPPRDDVLRIAIRRYMKTGDVASFKALKYICYGISLAVDEQESCLADQPQSLRRLLAQVDEQRGEDRRFVRCYQALLRSYFAFTGAENESATQLQTQPSFLELRGFLSDRLEVVVRPIRGRVAGWAITLQEHRNLLGERPCQRYTDELAQGKTDQLAEVCRGLGIGRESWIWQEVILAYLRDVCQRDDRGFKQSLGQALDLSEGQTALTPSTATSRTVVAQVVKRYSEAVEKPELPRLRDASIHWIGNPWLRRANWDAWVRHEPARQMVDGWLKSKLMEDFFTLLSDKTGGAVDRRRLTYWLRYVDVIEDMWFMLGSDAYHDRSPEFAQMRSRMKGRMKPMAGSAQRQNNAFVMRIGDHLIVEFGSKGNACYFYHAEQKAFDDSQGPVSIYSLKQGHNKESHSGAWESKFNQVMHGLFGRDILREPKYQPVSSTRSVENSPPSLSPPSVKPLAPVAPPVVTPVSVSRTAVLAETKAAPDTGFWHEGERKSGAASAAPTSCPPEPITAPSSRQSSASQEFSGQLNRLFERCRRIKLLYKDLSTDEPCVWIHKNAEFWPTLERSMLDMGFMLIEDGELSGYWLGDPVSSGTRVHVDGAGSNPIASTLATCDRLGIEWVDLRERGGNLWVYTDPVRFPAIVERLRLQGFRFSDKRGAYWLPGDE